MIVGEALLDYLGNHVTRSSNARTVSMNLTALDYDDTEVSAQMNTPGISRLKNALIFSLFLVSASISHQKRNP